MQHASRDCITNMMELSSRKPRQKRLALLQSSSPAKSTFAAHCRHLAAVRQRHVCVATAGAQLTCAAPRAVATLGAIEYTAYGICNPSTGRDCFSRHCIGESSVHIGGMLQKNKRKAPATREGMWQTRTRRRRRVPQLPGEARRS